MTIVGTSFYRRTKGRMNMTERSSCILIRRQRWRTRSIAAVKRSLAGWFLLTAWTIASAQTTPKSNTVVQQKFALEPFDRTAIVGTTVILPCRVVNRVGTIQWTRDGFGLGSDRILTGFPRYAMSGSDEEENYSLQIENVNLEDDAVFQCQVGAADSVKGIRSKTAMLTVFVPPEPPRIVQGDFLQTTAGITVELTCESHGGKPAAELTWLDGEGMPVTSKIESAVKLMEDQKRADSTVKWTFVPSRQHDGKTFSCRAENQALPNPLYASIQMEVKYPPEITLKVNSEKIMEFDDVTFTCDAIANPAEVVYKWYRNDTLLPGGQATIYTFRKVTRDYNKNSISCEVGNSVGTTKSTHVLNIHYGPILNSPVENLAVDLGSKVKLDCNVDGNPQPEIVWTYENSENILSTKAEHVIPEMRPNLAGKYTCKATVPGFTEVKSEIMVFVRGPPKIISPSVQYGIEGEMVKLECVIKSIPEPNRIMWTKNSKVVDIDNSEGYEIIKEVTPDGVKNLLVIRKADEEDFGQYNCSVWNDFGHHSIVISLQKQKSLPMLIILAGVIGGIVLIVSVTIIIILCLRRKSIVKDDDYGSEKKTKQSDSGSSGDSDLKVEIRTASSLSNTEHERSWEDNSDTMRNQDSQDIYKYAADYAEPTFPPKVGLHETQNNNGYIPYVDYSRDYNPPSVHLNTSRDGVYGSTAQQSLHDLGPAIDPRYSAGYANPYLRTSQSSLPPSQGVYVSPRGSMAGNTTPVGHNRYITAQQSQTHLKPGTLATHV